MAVEFLSDEWEKQMKKRLSHEFNGNCRIATTFVQIVEGAPDSQQYWMLLQLEKDRLIDYSVGRGRPPEAELSATANYQIYKRLLRSNSEPGAGLLGGDFQLGGNVIKAVGLVSCYRRLERVQRSIATIFPEL